MVIKIDFNSKKKKKKKIRKRLGINKDDILEIRVDGKKIILEKIEKSDK